MVLWSRDLRPFATGESAEVAVEQWPWPAGEGVPKMTQVQAIMTPWSPVGDFMLMWLQMLPVTVLVAWLTGRLLGVRRRSLLMAFAAGSAGSLVGCTLAAPDAVGTMLLLASVFTMAATVGLQLLARPQPTATMRGLPTGVPHPLRWLHQHLQRQGRYLQITQLAVHHGLGPYLGLGRARQPDGAAVAPERRARLALEQAGGMFVKLGQMLSTRPDVVPPALA